MSEPTGRSFNQSLGLFSIIYIVIGILLILRPAAAIKLVCYIIAAALVIYGIIRIISYITSDAYKSSLQPNLVVGIIAIVIGLFIFLRPVWVASILPTLAGICILIDSIIKIQNALDLKRAGMIRWVTPLIIAIVTAVLGLLLIINPFGATQTLVICTGIFFVIDGVANLTSVGLVFKKIGRPVSDSKKKKKKK